MAGESTEDRIHKFLLERGEEGATSTELASRFLRSKWVPDAVADRIIAPLLNRDNRFVRAKAGRWTAARGTGAPRTSTYTVAEFLFAQGVAGRVPVECGVVRLQKGRAGDARVTPLNPPEPLAPGAQRSAGLNPEELQNAPALDRVLRRLSAFASGTTLVSYERTAFHVRAGQAPGAEPVPYLSIKKLARRMGIISRTAGLRDCAEALGVIVPQQPRAGELASASAEVLRILLARLEEQGIRGSRSIDGFLRPQYDEPDFSRYAFDRPFLESLPEGPGIYIVKDANGTPIYVGKAKNLRKRVGSYFARRVQVDNHARKIRERAVGLTFERAGSELEALLLEYRAIAQLTPELNQQEAVRPRPEHYERPSDIIVPMPSREQDHVELFMVVKGQHLVQLSVPRQNPQAARPAVVGAWFGGTPPAPTGGAEELELVWGWLRRNRDRVGVIDVNAAAGPQEIMRLLAEHVAEEETPGERTYRV